MDEKELQIETPEEQDNEPLLGQISFEELLAEMMQLASFQNISFVYGKGKRKTQIQRDIDLFFVGR